MSIRSMDNRLEVLRSGQDITNKSILLTANSAQLQQQQQAPTGDVDTESNKSDSWVELMSPSRASMASMNGGDSGSVVLVESDGAFVGTDTTVAGSGSTNRLSPTNSRSAPFELIVDGGQGHGSDVTVVRYIRHGSGRRVITSAGMAGLGQRTKRTVEWLESYNSRPEVNRSALQAPSPVETELSTPPNSLVLGELTQSSCCGDEEEMSAVDDEDSGKKEQWTVGGFLSGTGRRTFVLCLMTNLMTLALGIAIGITFGRKSLPLMHLRNRHFFGFS